MNFLLKHFVSKGSRGEIVPGDTWVSRTTAQLVTVAEYDPTIDLVCYGTPFGAEMWSSIAGQAKEFEFRRAFSFHSAGGIKHPKLRPLIPVGAPTPSPAGAERDFGADLRTSPADDGQKHPAPTPAGAERDLDAGKRDKPATDGLLRAACVDQVNDECASRKGLKESALGAQAAAAVDAGGASDVSALERASREIDEERALGAHWIDAPIPEPQERRRAEHLYTITASDYGRGPVGSPDWRLYWAGFAHRALIKEQVPAVTSAHPVENAAYTEILVRVGAEQVVVYESEEGFKRPGAAAEMARLASALVEQVIGVEATNLTRMPARSVFEVGDIVTRDGTDEQEVTRADDGGGCITVVCRKAPEDEWCKVGEEEDNLTRRYTLVRRRGEIAEGGAAS